jgi:hypothetical protein
MASPAAPGARDATACTERRGFQGRGRIEVIPPKSRTLTGEESLRGDAQGRDIILAGELRLPPSVAPEAAPRFAAVVLVHGSGGVSGPTDLRGRSWPTC